MKFETQKINFSEIFIILNSFLYFSAILILFFNIQYFIQFFQRLFEKIYQIDHPKIALNINFSDPINMKIRLIKENWHHNLHKVSFLTECLNKANMKNFEISLMQFMGKRE